MEKAPVVWINSFPGVGKLTIAKKLTLLLGNATCVLVDNHQLIDPVEAKLSRAHPDYQKERKLQREAMFERYFNDPSMDSQTIMFTDFQTNNQLGREVAAEYKKYAAAGGRSFLPIYLACEINENIRRIMSRERVNSGTTKLVDPDYLRAIRGRSELFIFEDFAGLSLDITELQPDEAARRIGQYIAAETSYGPEV